MSNKPNLFYYKRKIKDKDGNEITVMDAFNPDFALRVYTISEDKVVILLTDGHEEAQDVEVAKPNNKGTEIKRQRVWVSSEIILDREDADRLQSMCYTEPLHPYTLTDEILR